MRWILAVLLTLALARDEVSSGPIRKVALSWQCLQTRPLLPESIFLNIKLNIDTGEFDLSEIDGLLNQAISKARTTDYTNCFSSFDWTAEASIKGLEGDKKLLETLAANVRKAIRSKVAFYSSTMEKEGALTPVEPAAHSEQVTGQDVDQYLDWLARECDNYILSNPDYLDLHVLKALPRVTPLLSESCRKKVEAAYARVLLDTQPSEQVCAANPTPCQNRRLAIVRATELLAKAGLLQNAATQASDAKTVVCRMSNGEPAPEHAKLLNELLYGVARSQNPAPTCHRLEVGQQVRFRRVYMGSPTASSYTLQRLADRSEGVKTVKAYKAYVDLDFKSTDTLVTAELKERTKECFQSVNPKLRDQNGDQLELELYNAKDKSIEAPPKVSIAVLPEGSRSNSAAWKKDVTCSTILHESLHLLGLVDKYRETLLGSVVAVDGSVIHAETEATIPDWDCRVLGPRDSIMHFHYEALDKAIQRKVVTICFCPSGAAPMSVPGMKYESREEFQRCEELHASAKNLDSCPSGTFEELYSVTMDSPDHSRVQFFPAKKLFGFVRQSYPGPAPTKNTLLYPAEFRAITQPGCRDVNDVYYRCSSESYRTSRKNFGTDKCAVTLPPECNAGGAAWLK